MARVISRASRFHELGVGVSVVPGIVSDARVFGVANIATRGLDGFVQFARAIDRKLDRHHRGKSSQESCRFWRDIGVALGIIRVGNVFHLRVVVGEEVRVGQCLRRPAQKAVRQRREGRG